LPKPDLPPPRHVVEPVPALPPPRPVVEPVPAPPPPRHVVEPVPAPPLPRRVIEPVPAPPLPRPVIEPVPVPPLPRPVVGPFPAPPQPRPVIRVPDTIPPLVEINNLSDVPANISALTTSQIVHCLELLCLGKYAEVFKENQINGSLLVVLGLEELREEPIGMNKLEAKKLQRFVNGWRPT
jgi:hypothetical protein